VENDKRPHYPVLCFSQGLVTVEPSEEDLTTCSRIALKHGYYSNMVIVDCTGRRFSVENATKLHGVGPFSGYNIFLNQTIRVALIFAESGIGQVTTDEVRDMVLKRMGPDSGWASREDFAELKMKIRRAATVREIIESLAVNTS
jgi:hypothetical protein